MKFDVNKLSVPERPRFFEGQRLTADDLRAAQDYFREKMWRHNRMLHGYGIVTGLEVAVQENESGDAQVVVAPGYGLDGYGRELIVTEVLNLSVSRDRRDFVVYVKYTERDDTRMSAAPEAQTTRVVETVQVLFEPPADRLTPPPTRPDFAIPLARLRKPHLQWQHDRNFRAPRAK